MTAIRFDPWAELAVLENAESGGAPAKVAKAAKVVPADVPAEWVDGVARLGTLTRPDMVRRHRWWLAIKDARRFLRDWGAQASALGWATVDIFGCHPTRPAERIDCAGLIILLRGAEVVAITGASACTRNRTGATLSYRRRPLPESVPLWELRGEVLPADAAVEAR